MPRAALSVEADQPRSAGWRADATFHRERGTACCWRHSRPDHNISRPETSPRHGGTGMDQHAVDDVNRKLAILAAKHGFAATARKAPRSEPRVFFDAFRWRDQGIWNYCTSYLES